MHEKDKYHYITSPIQPKLLADAPGNLVVNHYSVTFEETIVLRTSDLQLGDHGKPNLFSVRYVFTWIINQCFLTAWVVPVQINVW